MIVCHSRESGNPDLLMVLDSAKKPALSKAEWLRNDIPQSTPDKEIALFEVADSNTVSSIRVRHAVLD